MHLRRAIAIAVFLLVMAAGASILSRVYLTCFPELVAAKLRYIDAHADEIGVIFVGSSMVHRHIDPETFDATLAERGHALRAFNFGIPGAEQHQIDAIVREILARNPPALKYIVITAARYHAEPARVNAMTDEMVWWHSLEGSAAAARTIWGADESMLVKLQQMRMNLLQTGKRYFMVGQGFRVIEAIRSRADSSRPAWETTRGFVGLSGFRGQDGPGDNSRFEDPAVRKAFEGRVRLLADEQKTGRAIPHENPPAVRATQAAILRSGRVPVYLIAPRLESMPAWIGLRDAVVVHTLFAFNDPESFPELYRFDDRYDDHHLTQDAARVYTTHVAERIAALLDAQEPR